ncbi:zinc finger domain-containing protein [Staphylococcus aureus]
MVIEHADGEKCERCWNYSRSLGAVDELTHNYVHDANKL